MCSITNLDTIDDFESSIWIDLCNVARMHPSFVVDSFSRVLLIWAIINESARGKVGTKRGTNLCSTQRNS